MEEYHEILDAIDRKIDKLQISAKSKINSLEELLMDLQAVKKKIQETMDRERKILQNSKQGD